MNCHLRTVMVAALAGFAGASLATYLNPNAAVHAQEAPLLQETVQAKSFVMLDGSGRKRGEWKLDASGDPVLQLLDQGGRVIWEAGKPKMRTLSH